ncbi:hypothetical protein POSPLADRAFT_1030765 [Postia placenta MAD-698-R-SB12]|uniref:Uncharacterized protein n=1 Tax=Postia placenta MAD-698-R-SB12 TaxID=670580 RepID=A0A1X6NGW3_9APHY|nr:hypothetical protein POSPLADRAFT_1030765 [Postia placenta MAD-698-R-SB12]OSX67877.1 hypothetical protein POSPLADRAFT_1030765 [Postia placenta MAD-698-R-SB12]
MPCTVRVGVSGFVVPCAPPTPTHAFLPCPEAVETTSGLSHALDELTSVAASEVASGSTVDQEPETQAFFHADPSVCLRRKRNATLPINQLPLEILEGIFKLVPELFRANEGNTSDLEFSIWESQFADIKDVLVLTHICSHWREVAIHIPELWTSLPDIRTAGAVDAIAARSGTCPLKISMRDQASPGMQRILRAHGQRVIELLWDQCDIKLASSLRTLNFNAPVLRTLALSGIPLPSYFRMVTILRNTAPQLRNLSISDMDWVPGVPLPAVTNIYISRLYGRHALLDLLNFPAWCSRLENVVITHQDFVRMDSSDMPGPVTLPNLRRLAFVGVHCEVVTTVLTEWSINSDTALRIVCPEIPEENTDAFFSRLAGIPTVQDITRLSIYNWADSPTVVAVGGSSGISFEVIEGERYRHGQEMVSLALPRFLPMNKVRELWLLDADAPKSIEDCAGCESHTMRDVLRAFPALEVLTVSDGCAAAIAELPDSEEFCVSCPALFTLHIVCTGTILHHDEAWVAAMLVKLAQRHDYVPFKRVLIGYMPGYKQTRLYRTDADSLFGSVEYRDLALDEVPYMPVPELCKDAHKYWTGFEAKSSRSSSGLPHR